jgi:hypothetical protein
VINEAGLWSLPYYWILGEMIITLELFLCLTSGTKFLEKSCYCGNMQSLERDGEAAGDGVVGEGLDRGIGDDLGQLVRFRFRGGEQKGIDVLQQGLGRIECSHSANDGWNI